MCISYYVIDIAWDNFLIIVLKMAPARMRTGVSIMAASRKLDSWWTIAHNIFICFFFLLLQSSSQQEIYWAAKLWSSNWLRKNLNEFLNIQLKSIATLFILGLRQIEIETINWSTSFWRNEGWQLRSKYHIYTVTYSSMRHTHAHIIDILTHNFYSQQKYMTAYIFIILKL